MTNTTLANDRLTLRYSSFDGYLVGVVLVFIALVACLVLIFGHGLYLRQIALLVAGISGVSAFGLLRRTGRQSRIAAWYLSFLPNMVQINFVDYGKIGAEPPPETAILDIPRDEILMIRRSIVTGFDDGPQLYVDMRVTRPIWETAKEKRSAYQSHHEPLTRDKRAGSVQFFEGEMLRILLDAKHWPSDLSAFWTSHQYPVAEDYDIRQAARLAAQA